MTQLGPHILTHQDTVVPLPLLLHLFFFSVKVVNSSKSSVRALSRTHSFQRHRAMPHSSLEKYEGTFVGALTESKARHDLFV